MIISKRLKRIAESIDGYDSIADIGSDHAYLPIYLIKNKKINKAIASDVNEGPVKIAQHRIKQYRVSEYIDIRKGNGLEVLDIGEAEAIIIAGMGGILISEILEQGLTIARSAKVLILQPMRDSDRVRMFLIKNGFRIADEELVKDEGKIYEIIWAIPEDMSQEYQEPMLIGKHLIKKRHPLLIELTNKRIKELEKILISLNDKSSDNCLERIQECNKLLSYYREVRKWIL